MPNELKPCPFCGGEAKLTKTTECHGHGMYLTKYYVMCEVCGCRGESDCVYYKTEQECKDFAVSRWNRRFDNG